MNLLSGLAVTKALKQIYTLPIASSQRQKYFCDFSCFHDATKSLKKKPKQKKTPKNPPKPLPKKTNQNPKPQNQNHFDS